jgi:hypothetical protein
MYCPPVVKLKDPHNMPLEHIQTVLRHIKAREATHGAENAFRFSKYWHKTELRDAAYTTAPNVHMRQTEQHHLEVTVQAGRSDGPQMLSASPDRDGSQVVDHHPHSPHSIAANTSTRAARGGRGSGNAATSAAITESHNTMREIETVQINQTTMGKLGEFHIPTPIPTNGPVQGLPTYYVPQETAALLLQDNIDPAILEESLFTPHKST